MYSKAKENTSQLYGYLRQAILTLQLEPVADLDEGELCTRFSLSRTPLREVFRQLAGEGYVELRENRGARVMQLGHTAIRDLFAVAPVVMNMTLRLAARNATPAQIEELKKSRELCKFAFEEGSFAQRALADVRFHSDIAEMAANPYLLPSFTRMLIDHTRIQMTLNLPHQFEPVSDVQGALKYHDATIEAITMHDEYSAAQLVEERLNLSRMQMGVFSPPEPLLDRSAIPMEVPRIG